MKNLHMVMIVMTPTVSVGGIESKPNLPSGIVGYCPVYSNKKSAKKDYPRRELKLLKKVLESK